MFSCLYYWGGRFPWFRECVFAMGWNHQALVHPVFFSRGYRMPWRKKTTKTPNPICNLEKAEYDVGWETPTQIPFKGICGRVLFLPMRFFGVRLDLAFWTFEVVIWKSLRGHYHDLFWWVVMVCFMGIWGCPPTPRRPANMGLIRGLLRDNNCE